MILLMEPKPPDNTTDTPDPDHVVTFRHNIGPQKAIPSSRYKDVIGVVFASNNPNNPDIAKLKRYINEVGAPINSSSEDTNDSSSQQSNQLLNLNTHCTLEHYHTR